MYFASRMQAGRMLASQIKAKYAGKECAVVALTDGGVVVGSQIALALHAPLCMLLSDEIQLPREVTALAGITGNGAFSYNRELSEGQISEMVGEYRGTIEAQKLDKMHALHRDMIDGDLIREDMLANRHVILVSDAFVNGFILDLASEYLKPIDCASVVMAAPFASVQAVDRMHVLADDLYCLNVLEDFISVDHYYDTQDVPDHTLVIKTVARIVEQWSPARTETAAAAACDPALVAAAGAAAVQTEKPARTKVVIKPLERAPAPATAAPVPAAPVAEKAKHEHHLPLPIFKHKKQQPKPKLEDLPPALAEAMTHKSPAPAYPLAVRHRFFRRRPTAGNYAADSDRSR